MNKQEKKRDYNDIILQIDHGTFTPLVFLINVSMGRECQKFYSRLAQMIFVKKETFHSQFQVIGFEQKLVWVAKIKSALFKRVESSMQKNSGI